MEHVRAYASKSAEQAARIAGVLTLWADLNAPEVTPQAMSWGVTLADFYLAEARRLAEAGLVSDATAKAEALRRWLLEGWQYPDVTLREMVQSGPTRLRETAPMRATVAVLVKAGWLVALPEGTEVRGSARKEAWRIVRPAHVV